MHRTVRPEDLTAFLLVRALPAWLALPRGERRAIAAAAAPIQPGLELRLFDCEAFTALCSDVWMLSAPSAHALNAAVERLRDTPIFAVPYFDLVAILPAIENGFRRYEEGLAEHGGERTET